MRVEPRVGMRLSHITHVTHTPGSRLFITHYRLQTAWANRPPEGIQTGYLRCATCRNMVGFRLHSEASTTARKRRWLVSALIAALLCAGVSIATIRYDLWGALHSGFAIMGMLALMAALGLASWGCLFMLLAEDGVTPLRQSGQHRFKPPRALAAWSKPPQTDWPVSAEIIFHDSDPLDPRA